MTIYGRVERRNFICFIAALFISITAVGITTATAATWKKIIDYGDAGYSETGKSWRNYVNAQSYNGSYRYLSSWESGVPRSGTATWKTTIPYDGWYKVSVSYRQTENRSHDANFFVTNNTGGMDEFVINQRGHLTFIWRTLGEYYYTQGQVVKVYLDGRDDDYSDCADAASWEKVTPTSNLNAIMTHLLNVERKTITVTKDGSGDGKVTSLPGGIDCGGKCSYDFAVDSYVNFYATPDRGSSLNGWSGGGCSGTGACVVNVDGKTTVNATFTALPERNLQLTVTGSGNGQVSSSPVDSDGDPFSCSSGNTCNTNFYQNENVTLTADLDRNTKVTSWSGNCSVTSDPSVATLNMGTADKTCTSTLGLRSEYNLSVTLAGTGTGRVTSSPVSIDDSPIDCTLDTCSKNYYEAEVVTLTPSADSGSAFKGWTGDADCADGIVTMSAATSCTATFDIGTTYELTVHNVSDDASYGTITSSPSGINCEGEALSFPEGVICKADFVEGTEITLSATTDSPTGDFDGWAGDCVDPDDPDYPYHLDTSITFTIDGDMDCWGGY